MSGINGGCPFCVDNRKVDIVRWTSDERYYLVKAYGHDHDYLIIPTPHVTSLFDLDSHLIAATTELLSSIPWYYHGAAFNLSLNIGRQAGQRIEHLHLWVVYRDKDPDDGLGLATLAKLARQTS